MGFEFGANKDVAQEQSAADSYADAEHPGWKERAQQIDLGRAAATGQEHQSH